MEKLPERASSDLAEFQPEKAVWIPPDDAHRLSLVESEPVEAFGQRSNPSRPRNGDAIGHGLGAETDVIQRCWAIAERLIGSDVHCVLGPMAISWKIPSSTSSNSCNLLTTSLSKTGREHQVPYGVMVEFLHCSFCSRRSVVNQTPRCLQIGSLETALARHQRQHTTRLVRIGDKVVALGETLTIVLEARIQMEIRSPFHPLENFRRALNSTKLNIGLSGPPRSQTKRCT